jgi:hypothetical protein
VLLAEVLALEIVKSRMVLSEITLVPAVDLIPFISPEVPGVALVVPFVRLAIVLLHIVTLPVPALLIPKTLWALLELAELALMLFDVIVLPIILLLIVVVPVEVLLIP